MGTGIARPARPARPARLARHGAGRALTVALALALTGCRSLPGGGAGSPPTDDDVPGGTPTESGAPTEPAAPGTPVLQVSRSGGFVPMGYDFSAVPELTVYADGRAIVPGPQILIYPGPLLPNLQVVQLSEADVGALVDAARDADLLGAAPDYGLPNVTDLPTTYVTLTVDGRSYLHAAYALGFVEGEGTTQDDGLPAGGSGLTDEQAAARISLTELIDAANALVTAQGSSTPYAIEAFGVLAQQIDLAVEGASSPDAQVMPWPLDAALADLAAIADTAECTVIDGAAARRLLDALGSATQATLFEQDGDTYSAWFRPLLPHEDGCADLGVGG